MICFPRDQSNPSIDETKYHVRFFKKNIIIVSIQTYDLHKPKLKKKFSHHPSHTSKSNLFFPCVLLQLYSHCSVQFSRSALSDCDPVEYRTPGFHVLYQNSWNVLKHTSIESVTLTVQTCILKNRKPKFSLRGSLNFNNCLQIFFIPTEFMFVQFSLKFISFTSKVHVYSLVLSRFFWVVFI